MTITGIFDFVNKIFLSILFVFRLSLVFGQYSVTGFVYDKQTHEPLAFVNIVTVTGLSGTSTNIEGRFLLNSSVPVSAIRLSYIGYKTTEFIISGSHVQKIYLEKSEIELEELIVLPGINPADLIMEKVFENRNINNPEKNTSFQYENYNKFFVTLALDSSLISNPEKIAKLDSNSRETIKMMDQQYLFLSESVTERKYIPLIKTRKMCWLQKFRVYKIRFLIY